MFRLLQLSILLLLSVQYAVGQTLLVPENFLLAKERLPLLNPAAGDTSRVMAVAGHRQYFAPLQKLRNSYLLGGVRLGKEVHSHYLRAALQSRNEGPYLARRALHLIYNYRLRTGSDSYVSAGVSTGLLGYYFDASNATGAASSTVVDLNAGIRAGYKSLSAGVSFNQLPDKLTTPRYAPFRYPRFLIFDYQWKKDLSPDLQLNHLFLYRRAPAKLSTVQTMADLMYKELFTGGVGFETLAGLYFYVDIGVDISPRNRLSFGAAYNSGILGKNAIKVNTIEFNIKLKV